MKITIKTLKGDQFSVDVEPSDSVGGVKEKIAIEKAEMPAARQKLIHAGKVLKDNTLISETGISENEFIVCMLTKEAAKPKPTPAPAAANPAPVSSPAPAAPAMPASTGMAAAAPGSQVPPAPAASSPATSTGATAPTTDFPPETIKQLTDMGFPEEEAQAALRAAMGNSGLAVEYLMNGIPDQAQTAAPAGQPSPASGQASAGTGLSGIEELRRHPQLNQLRRLVQQNPASLGQVLEGIGQQNPDLLRLIHANQSEFLSMMNEPITEDPPAQQQQGGIGMGMPGAGGEAPNPMQLVQMIQALPPDQRERAAQSLGMTPEQLQAFSQMLASLPPEQLERIMTEARDGRGGIGGMPPGTNIIRLTDEEMNSVNRLVELGFDQQDAVAAFIACDKNEALAANLLLEGWSAEDSGGAGFGF